MTEEDEAFEELAKRQGDWGLQGSRKHQIMRYLENDAMREVQRLGQEIEQEPVAWGVFDTQNLHDMFFTKEEAQDMARLKGDGSIVKPLYTHSPKENT